MHAPETIRQVWNRFQGIPIETFTKGWWHRRSGGHPRQRTVAEMIEHRRSLGTGGNCFDLALWLQHAFAEAGVQAWAVGHDLETPEAHVAVVASDHRGQEYLCDLGDLWLEPILIDPRSSEFSDAWHADLFPGRLVRIDRADRHLEVSYRRSSGKTAQQVYDLRPLGGEELAKACHHSQNLLRRPFCEVLLPHPVSGKRERWEFDRGASFWNLDDGPVFEEPCTTEEECVARIAMRSGLSPEIIRSAIQAYGGLGTER